MSSFTAAIHTSPLSQFRYQGAKYPSIFELSMQPSVDQGFRPLRNNPVFRTLLLCSCPNHLSSILQVPLWHPQCAPPLWCHRPDSPVINTHPQLGPTNLLHSESILVCNDGPVEGFTEGGSHPLPDLRNISLLMVKDKKRASKKQHSVDSTRYFCHGSAQDSAWKHRRVFDPGGDSS